jgi:nicotinate-nucleotide pyrophosphorylase (carboxylating)
VALSANQINTKHVSSIIENALNEDTSQGDITSEILIPPELQGKASIIAKSSGVLAGGEIVAEVFQKVDPSLKYELLIDDGSILEPGDIIATVAGKVVSILKGERVMLNFLQRLSGIASHTAEYISKTAGLPIIIVDTRKTTPGLRILEKYAVRIGGGQNHPLRMHLGDGILIKDNHLTALQATGMSLKEVVIKAKKNAPPGFKVEVEVTTVEEAISAAEAGADIIMLDNMSPEQMNKAVDLIPEGIKTEASGGITLENVRDIALTGVDIISTGALTHSSVALDISLELESVNI